MIVTGCGKGLCVVYQNGRDQQDNETGVLKQSGVVGINNSVIAAKCF